MAEGTHQGAVWGGAAALVAVLLLSSGGFLDVCLKSSRYGAGPRRVCMGVILHVAEGQEGGLCGPQGDVHILGLHDSGVREPTPRVADVG
jgi:hypothetical protein